MAELKERFSFLNREMECMDKERRRAWIEEKLKELVEFSYENSPYMKKLLDDATVKPEDIKGIEDLEKIPVIHKKDLPSIQAKNPPFGGLLAVPVTSLSHIYSSPGPIYDPEGRDENYWNWKEILVGAGFKEGDVVINTFSYHMVPGGYMFDEALRSLGCTVVPTGVGNTEDQVRLMKNLPVTGFMGMASFLLRIGEKALEMGEDPKSFGLEVALVTAEVLTEEMRSKVEDMFGITLRQCFGVADLGGAAYECYHKNGMHVASNVLIQICDPETGKVLPDGQVGEIVITPLTNRVYPIIRFGTGDLSYIMEGECPCGRTLPRIGRILGRVDDVVKVKGMFVHPQQVEETLRPFGVKGKLIVTREKERDKLKLIVEEGVDPNALGKRFLEVAKLRAVVEVVPKGSLEGGKLVEDRRKF